MRGSRLARDQARAGSSRSRASRIDSGAPDANRRPRALRAGCNPRPSRYTPHASTVTNAPPPSAAAVMSWANASSIASDRPAMAADAAPPATTAFQPSSMMTLMLM